MDTPDKTELRKFGFILAGGLIGIFGLLFPWLGERSLPWWPFIAGGVFALAGLVMPAALGPVYRVWMKIGHVLGWINTRIILGVVFFLIFLPVSLIFRVIGKDPMARKLDDETTSYRVESHQPQTDHLEKPF